MVDFYSVLSPMMTTQKKILPAGVTFNPSSFLSQSPDFLKPGLFLVQSLGQVLGYDDCYDSGACPHDYQVAETHRLIAFKADVKHIENIGTFDVGPKAHVIDYEFITSVIPDFLA